MAEDAPTLLALTAKVVEGYVRKNEMPADQLSGLMAEVRTALSRLQEGAVEPTKAEPVVPVKRSVKQTEIICLECGRGMKTLKRHLRSDHGLTPDEYREKYELQRNYPMVAPEYAAQRSVMAKQIGLGSKRGESPKRTTRKKT